MIIRRIYKLINGTKSAPGRIFREIILNALILGFTVLQGLSLKAQAGFLDSLNTKFLQYRVNHLQEKIFVHTDKSFYLTGEILWFKLYNVDAGFHLPINVSKVAYIEIISKDKKPVLQTKIALNDGNGNGSIGLPSYLLSGNYIFRAYTNWMRNWPSYFYFEKSITIVNPARRPDWPTPDTAATMHISFHPEGGNLVYGIRSKVAFKVTDQYQKGIDCNGILVNQNNDTIASFHAIKFGMGQFYFTPVNGEVYKAFISAANGRTIAHELPAVYEEGYVMNLYDTVNDQVKIKVHSTGKPIQNPVYLFVHTRNSIQKAFVEIAENGVAEFAVNKNELGDGISSFTVFDKEKRPVCERLYFTRPTRTLHISIKSDRENYDRRKKISLELQTSDNTGKDIPADLSLSVFLLDSLESFQSGSIESWLWLSSELRGQIEEPEYYFSDHVSDEAIENLMLTHGWRRFKWEDVLGDKTPYFEFEPEYAGHIISGKVTDKKTGKPAKGVTAYLSIPGEKFYFSNSTSNQNGQVYFDVKKLYGIGNIIVQTNHLLDSAYRIEIKNPYSDEYSGNPIPPFDLPEKWKAQLIGRGTNTRLQDLYSGSIEQEFFLPDDADTLSFYGRGEKTYNLDDYTRFATMEEVLREYVTEVQVRKTRGEFHLKMINLPYKSFFENDPLLLVDGVPVFETGKIISLDPLKIKKLEIITRKFYQGSKAYDGILSYHTYEGDLGGFELDPNALFLEYQGLQLQRNFYSPSYESSNEAGSRLPDFRTQLYWEPDIKTDGKGQKSLSFYGSDIPGRYLMIVQGISENGLPGNAILSFEVNK